MPRRPGAAHGGDAAAAAEIRPAARRGRGGGGSAGRAVRLCEEGSRGKAERGGGGRGRAAGGGGRRRLRGGATGGWVWRWARASTTTRCAAGRVAARDGRVAARDRRAARGALPRRPRRIAWHLGLHAQRLGAAALYSAAAAVTRARRARRGAHRRGWPADRAVEAGARRRVRGCGRAPARGSTAACATRASTRCAPGDGRCPCGERQVLTAAWCPHAALRLCDGGSCDACRLHQGDGRRGGARGAVGPQLLLLDDHAYCSTRSGGSLHGQRSLDAELLDLCLRLPRECASCANCTWSRATRAATTSRLRAPPPGSLPCTPCARASRGGRHLRPRAGRRRARRLRRRLVGRVCRRAAGAGPGCIDSCEVMRA